MTFSWKWACFVVCTILFGLSPYLFMLVNMNITHGSGELNYYVFYTVLTLPIAVIILAIAALTELRMTRGKSADSARGQRAPIEEQPTPVPMDPTKIQCGSCKRMSSRKEKYCSHCGYNLDAEPIYSGD
jgi:hypothetical protein